MRSVIVGVVALTTGIAIAQDAQVTLRSGQAKYAAGQIIELSYETLWLGDGDGIMLFNSLAFPELEILYLNRWPVEKVVASPYAVRSQPSRHETAGFAPTMRRESPSFSINDPESPARYLDGTIGYYVFDRLGTYVIRAVFRAQSDWPIYQGQVEDIRSNALVIEIER